MENNKFSFLAGEYDSSTNLNSDDPEIGRSTTWGEATSEQKETDSQNKKNQKINELREERDKEEKEDSPAEKRLMVIDGAKLNCPYAQAEGVLKVTSNELNLQDKIWATEGDKNNMVNLQFPGICNHPKWGDKKPPCMSVINLGSWENLGTTIVQEQKVLVKESCISCNPTPNSAVVKPVPKVEQILKEDGNIDLKSTYFLFFDNETKKPISGLKVYLKTSDNKIINSTTNNKGYIQINSNNKGPYTLLNSKHPEITKDTTSIYYKNFYTLGVYEKKDSSYIKQLTQENLIKSTKGFLPYTALPVISSENLESYVNTYKLSSYSENNKNDLLYCFNWDKPIKNSYYNFDFGKEGVIFIPKMDYCIGKLDEKITHIFYFSNELKRQPLSQEILSSTNIIKRNIWSKIEMNNYDILDPKKIDPKRSKIDFDWEYHTIVLHNSGNKLSTKVNEIENLHRLKNKWEDIGYHYIIGRKENKESNIYEGRPLIFKGSHAGKLNTQKIGILVEGDFEHQWWDFDDDVEQEQLVLLEKLISALVNNIPTIKNLVGHSDVIGKSADDNCPGEELYKYIPELRLKFNLSNKIINL